MNDLEPRERALLAIVGAGEGTLTARSIDIRLSQRHMPSGETVLATLKRLQAAGYVHRVVTAGSPHDAWVLTDEGRSLLESSLGRHGKEDGGAGDPGTRATDPR
jgi:Mn-dependent DtxR family transcriptional regulator